MWRWLRGFDSKLINHRESIRESTDIDISTEILMFKCFAQTQKSIFY